MAYQISMTSSIILGTLWLQAIDYAPDLVSIQRSTWCIGKCRCPCRAVSTAELGFQGICCKSFLFTRYYYHQSATTPRVTAAVLRIRSTSSSSRNLHQEVSLDAQDSGLIVHHSTQRRHACITPSNFTPVIICDNGILHCQVHVSKVLNRR